jgi:hypothetical protein
MRRDSKDWGFANPLLKASVGPISYPLYEPVPSNAGWARAEYQPTIAYRGKRCGGIPSARAISRSFA